MQFSSNKKINKIIKKIISAFIIAMISLSICFVFFQVEPINVPGKTLQNIVYDNFFRLINDISKQDKSKTDDVIIVAIDDASLKNFQEKKHILWPWPRNIYAIISQHLINEGAKAVVFDVIFNNPDIDRVDTYGEDNDLFFYSIIKNTGKVILPFNIDNKLETDNMLDVVEIENVEHFKNIKEYKSIIFPPYELFTKNNTNFGFVDIEAELDGVIREYFPFVKIKDKCYPSLATTTYLLANKKRMPENMFLNKNGSFKINWYGPGGVNKTFAYSPVLLIISDFINKRRGLPLDIPEGAFKDKVIFIGGTARGLLDMKSTPFSKDEAYPGVEIHATAYLNMVQKSEIKSLSPFLEFSIYFIIIFILLFFGVKTKAIKKYSIIFFLSMIIIFISQFFIFNYFKIMTQTAFVIVAFLIAYLITQVYNYITEGRTSNMIKNALSSYLSPELAKEVAESEKSLTVGGKNVVASALFIDIAGFTTFSEKNSVEKVVATLNLYLEKFSESIMKNKGFVNKYLGDGLMALFGAYPQYEDHADMAVKSAFECYKINNELAKEYGLNVRIGVNSGKMIVGNLGGGGKLEFTAIGDSINTTSRLEGANKFFSTNILIGEDTKKLLQNQYDINYVGKFSLKGKDIPYGIYYYCDAADEYKKRFSQMIKVYENNDLETFKKYIKYFASLDFNFGPAVFYQNYYQKNEKKFGKPIKFTEK